MLIGQLHRFVLFTTLLTFLFYFFSDFVLNVALGIDLAVIKTKLQYWLLACLRMPLSMRMCNNHRRVPSMIYCFKYMCICRIFGLYNSKLLPGKNRSLTWKYSNSRQKGYWHKCIDPKCSLSKVIQYYLIGEFWLRNILLEHLKFYNSLTIVTHGSHTLQS